ncbi:MAG: 4-alpha-glucanotransferase [Verrucomicrobiota bacterium]|nr:4-alpha-glucanotransferase [Verrucomicrobiota bacterium]
MAAPLFNWLQTRSTGVLMHPTSLPGNGGIGTLGRESLRFIDFLQKAGIGYWQLLPLGPTGYGDSPYQSFSAFAGNPYLIDLEALMEFGLLNYELLDPIRALPQERVDFGALYRTKWPLLRLAYRNFKEKKLAYLPNYGMFAEFCETHSAWLEPYGYFMALKQQFGGRSWTEWPLELRRYEQAQKSPLKAELSESIEAYAFYQYLFFGQWKMVQAYAKKAGIQIIGDLPIFVSLDSADVWARADLFELDKTGMPIAVAGVPPDYFSATGQLWGNPLFNWKALKAEGYAWWIERLRMAHSLCDVVRLDHFRGFYSYWRIPAPAENALGGKWVTGPGLDFFNSVREKLLESQIIAEDLGIIPPEVREFLARTGLPGMAILQFAYDGDADNLYLPHNLEKNTVLYPGTHDNNTTRGWYETANPASQDQLRRYFRISGNEVSWDLIRAAYASVARLVVIPMQDMLSLDGAARMNTPGSALGNWQWRYSREAIDQLEAQSAGYLKELAKLYGR